ncbi:gamma-glutamylcyclotransferase [uncultured Jannaschia sp.]|uniref:gamma-glutamylcyclotransferase n=1 Tax=uncultured Jannaschia sp. TaxID=293347 RepID=UPI00261D7A0A|nr:gamma-glutamylcyclotransferase [uncultured Jannaschia sp.]
MTQPPDLWVFGYGSLIYNPGIAVAETRRATLDGYRRRFCMWSVHHRGTEADPGLVLALEEAPGVACRGIAIRAADPEAAIVEIRERELISSAYHEARVTLTDDDGTQIEALAYVIDPDHHQYARDLTLEEQAAIIAAANGGRGPNHEYLSSTFAGLRGLEIDDPDLEWLVTRVQQIRAAA